MAKKSKKSLSKSASGLGRQAPGVPPIGKKMNHGKVMKLGAKK